MTARVLVAACAVALMAPLGAQHENLPTARLVWAPPILLPGEVDSSVPMLWDSTGGTRRLFAFASWGGVPAGMTGHSLDHMARVGPVTIVGHPGHGIWIESVIPDESGAWYGFYHHEIPAAACGRPERQVTRIGAARSVDRGSTWQDLGLILEPDPAGYACGSSNAFVLGGVGDVSVMLDRDRRDLYLYFSQYQRDPAAQGVALARLAWADRDAPQGRVSVWNAGVFLPARAVGADDHGGRRWQYALGTPLVRATRPWHDADGGADVFWGPSIHWNTYLERYVMLLNRAGDDRFNNEGIYVSYARALDDPRLWSAPRKIMTGGGWYPQVAGLDAQAGTDKLAGQRARFFLTGRSQHYIEFLR